MSFAPRLRQRLLDFLIRWGRYDDALPIVRRLAEDQPDGLLYRSNLVKVLAALGEFREAQDIAADLEYRYSQKLNMLAAYGDLEMAKGDLPTALKHYLQMLQVNDKSPKAWRRLARLYMAAGQIEKAHLYCRKIIDLRDTKRPDDDDGLHPDVLRVLSSIHRIHGDSALADEIESKLAAREQQEEDRLWKEVFGVPAIQQPIVTLSLSKGVETPVKSAPSLPQDMLTCMKEVFGHDGFRVGQEECVSHILDGRDVLVIMPTGGGKSLCYQLPAALGRRVVVISPLIALMKDQIDGLPESLAARATLINSSLDNSELERRLQHIASGQFNLVYAAPERLRQPPFIHALRKMGVDLFVVDEVHCVSIWGHDFRPDYLFIAPALKLLGNPPFCGMTATAGSRIREDINHQIDRKLVTVSAGIHRPNLKFEVTSVSNENDKLKALSQLCLSESGCGIVYANSRKKTEDIASFLRSEGVEAGHYHAGMEPELRSAAQNAFMRGECRVMAATVAFGMGVDKCDVRFVTHYSLPKSLENYYQEAGRAGRDGLPSRCVLLYSQSDKARLTKWELSDQVKMSDLKTIYEAIKHNLPARQGLVHSDNIQRNSGLDDTCLRVAISMLERVGLVRRHLDVPMTITIKVKYAPGASEEFNQFVSSARLRENKRLSLDTSDLCRRLGIPLHEIECELLEWRDLGWINYRCSGRTMCIELLKSKKGAKKALEDMLEARQAQARDKIHKLTEYAKSGYCRHDFIARHFGDEPIGDCQSCDNCISSAAPMMLTDDHMLILKGILCLPIRFGKTGLVKALAGVKSCPIRPHEWPYLGALSHMKRDSIKDRIEDLVNWGYLQPDGTVLRPLLALTAAGRKLAVGKESYL